MPRRIVLIHQRAPGDTVVTTSLVRDIALARPGEFEIDVDVHAPDFYRHNPYLTPLKNRKPQSNIEYIKLDYSKGIRDQRYETMHFTGFFHKDFERQTGVRIPLMLPYPDLHLSPDELDSSPCSHRYWLFIAGGKSDVTVKTHTPKFWQELIWRLRRHGIELLQIGSLDKGNTHPPIDGALNMLGKTNLRDMMRLAHHADGVICGVTCLMHVAAALQKPCVVVAGGREAWWWEAYVPENRGLGGVDVASKLLVPHRYLHTIGLLDCCRSYGCWKNKTVPLHDDRNLCVQPVMIPGSPVPKCLAMITPELAENAVLSYYLDGTVPPIPGSPLEAECRHVKESLQA